MNITFSNGSARHTVDVKPGSQLGIVHSLDEDRDEVGAPDSYSLTVNGHPQDDSYTLKPGDIISFRPKAGKKGFGYDIQGL